MAKRDIKYINKDFDSFNQELKLYLKKYFPDSFNDFNNASVGTAFVELMAYVGDVLSFYLDRQFNELFLSQASETDNVVKLAESLGYVPRGKSAAIANVNLSIDLPTITNLSTFPTAGLTGDLSLTSVVNTKLIPKVLAGTSFVASNQASTPFELTEDVDFGATAGLSLTRLSDNSVQFVKTGCRVIAGLTKEFQVGVADPEKFLTIELPDSDVLEIISVLDRDGNEYTEVDYLARSNVFKGKENIDASTSADVGFVLETTSVPRRFIKRRTTNNRVTLTFGAGTNQDLEDRTFIPAPEDFVLPATVRGSVSGATPASIDPTDLLETKTLGVAPSNTVLTISYRIGGGITTNVATGLISQVFGRRFSFKTQEEGITIQQDSIAQSLRVTNPEPATGGESEETIDEIRHNAGAYYASQGRVVTAEDYAVRLLTMPEHYGRLFRVSARRNIQNSTSMQLYVLSRDIEGKLTRSNQLLKQNAAVYLDQFRLASEAVEILDGDIINVGVDFTITTEPGFNRSAVLAKCLQQVQQLFLIEKFNFGRNIILSEIENAVHDNEGVRSVVDVKVFNITDASHSPIAFNVSSNTHHGEIHCPQDSIFELKFPELDISGKVA